MTPPRLGSAATPPSSNVDAMKDAFLAAINKIRALSASCEFKFSITNDYDNTPAPDTSFNYLTTLIGLSASL